MWTVALSEQEHEQHTADEVADLYAAGTIDADTFVWREGMDGWRTPFEVAELKLLLISRGLMPRSSDAGPPPEPERDKPVLAPTGSAKPEQNPASGTAAGSAPSVSPRSPAAAPPTRDPKASSGVLHQAHSGEDDWLKVFERPSLVDFSTALDSPRPRTPPPPAEPARRAEPRASPAASRSAEPKAAVPQSAQGSRPAPPHTAGSRPPAPKRQASGSPPSRPRRASPSSRPPAPRRGAKSSPPPRPKRGAPRSPAPQDQGSQISELDIQVDIEPLPGASFGVRAASSPQGAASGSPLLVPAPASRVAQPRAWLPRAGLAVLVLLLLVLVMALAVGITRRPAPLYSAYLKVFGPIENLLR
jgi:hypothetical protein